MTVTLKDALAVLYKNVTVKDEGDRAIVEEFLADFLFTDQDRVEESDTDANAVTFNDEGNPTE